MSFSVPAPCCPKCGSDRRQAKAGKSPVGSLRFHCHACDKDYTPQPKSKGYPVSVRQEAVRLSVEGLSLRRIARVLRVNHQSVANWIAAYQAALQAKGETTLPENQVVSCQTVELDELHTFIGCRRGEKNAGST